MYARQIDQRIDYLRQLELQRWTVFENSIKTRGIYPSKFNAMKQRLIYVGFYLMSAIRVISKWLKPVFYILALVFSIMISIMIYGYVTHPASYWQERLSSRLGSPIFSQDGLLLGSTTPLTQGDYGYIRTEKPPIEMWQKFIVALEDKNIFNKYRSICGIDPLGTIHRVARRDGGGSGLAQQDAKNLLAPDEERSSTDIFGKIAEVGAACSLYNFVGGANGIIRLYAEYAPVTQTGGTTRGVMGGGLAIFGKPPEELSDAQLALLAAMTNRNLSLAEQKIFENNNCANLIFEEDLAKRGHLVYKNKNAAEQCKTIKRAKLAVDSVLSGNSIRKNKALAELTALEKVGIQPQNPFQPTYKDKQILNLSLRARTVLPAAVLEAINSESLNKAKVGEPLIVAMTEGTFQAEIENLLKNIDKSPVRNKLCIPLGSVSDTSNRCLGLPFGSTKAEIVLVKVDLSNGGIKRFYASDKLVYDHQYDIASLGKMVIALVAVAEGYSSDSQICPRKINDNGHFLRRVTKPEEGYDQCSPKQLLSFAEVIARSDSLAAYELARSLGNEKLKKGLVTLGFTPNKKSNNLAYDLAFGTQIATAQQILTASQALFGVAFNIKVREQGPQFLVSDTDNSSRAEIYHKILKDYLVSNEQINILRTLLEAPAKHKHGTLQQMSKFLDAGKTGSFSTQNRQAKSRLIIGYSAKDHSINLMIIAAPEKYFLGSHNLSVNIFKPIMAKLVN